MPNSNWGSPRMVFQWKYFEQAPQTEPPSVLNIGAADDPLGFGEGAEHYDIDDWSAKHKYFTQGDAHALPYGDRSYDTVIMGDIHEHLQDPLKATLEAARVCSHRLVMTIFEEWRLPGPGQWIDEGHRIGDEKSRELGFADREDYQVKTFPNRKGYDDNVITHLIHVNQFTDEAVALFVDAVVAAGFAIVEFRKVFEAQEAGHDWFNWLICLERIK